LNGSYLPAAKVVLDDLDGGPSEGEVEDVVDAEHRILQRFVGLQACDPQAGVPRA
jgi:hypothetical protein